MTNVNKAKKNNQKHAPNKELFRNINLFDVSKKGSKANLNAQ